MLAQTFSPSYPLHAALHGAPITPDDRREPRPEARRTRSPGAGLHETAWGYPRFVPRSTTTAVLLGAVALSGYGAWRRYHRRTAAHDPRVSTRAGLTASESAVGSDDPLAQASAILADSDRRTDVSRDEPGVERRRSEDTVEL